MPQVFVTKVASGGDGSNSGLVMVFSQRTYRPQASNKPILMVMIRITNDMNYNDYDVTYNNYITYDLYYNILTITVHNI